MRQNFQQLLQPQPFDFIDLSTGVTCLDIVEYFPGSSACLPAPAAH